MNERNSNFRLSRAYLFGAILNIVIYFILDHDTDLIAIMTITTIGFATVIAVLEQIRDRMKWGHKMEKETMATLPNSYLNKLFKIEDFVEELIEQGRISQEELDQFLKGSIWIWLLLQQWHKNYST